MYILVDRDFIRTYLLCLKGHISERKIYIGSRMYLILSCASAIERDSYLYYDINISFVSRVILVAEKLTKEY